MSYTIIYTDKTGHEHAKETEQSEAVKECITQAYMAGEEWLVGVRYYKLRGLKISIPPNPHAVREIEVLVEPGDSIPVKP